MSPSPPTWIQCTPPSQPPPNLTAHDKISIRNLALPSGSPCPTIFGDIKPQPATISVQIALRKPFASAAERDALDESTVHYGELAKRVRSQCGVEAEGGGGRVLEVAVAVVEEMVAFKGGKAGSRAEGLEVELKCPKAGAYGGVLGLREKRGVDERGEEMSRERAFVARGMRVMVLVGVNASERRARQGVVVDLEVDLALARECSLEDCRRLFPLERVLAEMIEGTGFETLESLAEFCFRGLKDVLVERDISAHAIHLKFEKPAAIPWADGPVIEVHRSIS